MTACKADSWPQASAQTSWQVSGTTHAQHQMAHHKAKHSPAALGNSLSVAIYGVDQVEGGGSSGVVGPITAAQHPEVVAVQMKGMLLCAVAIKRSIWPASSPAYNQATPHWYVCLCHRLLCNGSVKCCTLMQPSLWVKRPFASEGFLGVKQGHLRDHGGVT